jgi:membrane protein YqaA with SNARE-associated domain
VSSIQWIAHAQAFLAFALYWILLGVASSIGLGTGLHTFVLYLGPHIAKVTMVAYECNYIPEMLPSRWNFTVFQDCPERASTHISFFTIILAVQLESFLWGFGTALGELPPYFISKAARLAGTRAEELDELDAQENSWTHRLKLAISSHLQKYSFITVLLMASIPNPLFDLAGLMCGHFGIPLLTFLGATVIGKAVFKVHLQMIFTIFLFSEHHIEAVLQFIEGFIPPVRGSLSALLARQKLQLHSPSLTNEKNWIQAGWEVCIILMIGYFVVSLLNSLVQNEHVSPRQANESKKPKKL